MPDTVDTSVYRNQPNPLATVGSMIGIANQAQSLQLGQQAQEIRQSQFQQGAADDLRMIAATMYNTGANLAQVKAAIVNRARQANYPPAVYQPYIDRLNSPEAQKDPETFLKNERTQAGQAGGLFLRQEAFPRGGGTVQTHPAAAFPASGAPAAQPPGYTETVSGNVKQALDLENSASTTNQQRADLGNLSAEANVVGDKFAPTFQLEKTVNQVLTRFGLPGTMTKEELAKGESTDKIIHQLTAQQTQAYGASDARQANSMASLPSTSLSGLGFKGVTSMMLGNTDAIDAKRNAWFLAKKKSGGQPLDYNQFNNEWNNQYDPRVFQIARLNDSQRKAFISTLDPTDQQELATMYANAVHDPRLKRWIKP